jgi:hypothetical protein
MTTRRRKNEAEQDLEPAVIREPNKDEEALA